MQFVRGHRRGLLVLGLLLAIGITTWIGVTIANLCVPALHVALMLTTALGTWLLSRDDMSLSTDGAVLRVLITGVALGLGLTWLAAVSVAFLGIAEGGHAGHTGLNEAIRHFLEDTAWRWTPLGLIGALFGTAMAIIVNEIGNDSEPNAGSHA